MQPSLSLTVVPIEGKVEVKELSWAGDWGGYAVSVGEAAPHCCTARQAPVEAAGKRLQATRACTHGHAHRLCWCGFRKVHQPLVPESRHPKTCLCTAMTGTTHDFHRQTPRTQRCGTAIYITPSQPLVKTTQVAMTQQLLPTDLSLRVAHLG